MSLFAPPRPTEGRSEAIRFHPVRQARLQYQAMQTCEHMVGEQQRCDRCLGSFAAIHAQHRFIEDVTVNHDPGYGHLHD